MPGLGVEVEGKTSGCRNQNSHLCNLVTLHLCSALKEENRPFGPVKELMPHWVTLRLLFSSKGVRWVGWCQPWCPLTHTAEQLHN